MFVPVVSIILANNIFSDIIGLSHHLYPFLLIYIYYYIYIYIKIGKIGGKNNKNIIYAVGAFYGLCSIELYTYSNI